jgi:hypothetical protein
MTPTESRQLASLIQTFTPIEKADFYYFTIVKNQDPMAYINNMEKASFGGDRSEAGRYAANIRWQGNRKGDEGGSPPEKPLKEQIEDVAAQLRGLSSFPETNVAGKSYSESYGQYFFYRKKG